MSSSADIFKRLNSWKLSESKVLMHLAFGTLPSRAGFEGRASHREGLKCVLRPRLALCPARIKRCVLAFQSGTRRWRRD